jgi:hypothetical protein
MKRLCGMCLAQGKRVEAKFVAADAGGLMWYECKDHHPRDNVADTFRTHLVPIEEFLARAGIAYEDLDDLEEPVPPTDRA